MTTTAPPTIPAFVRGPERCCVGGGMVGLAQEREAQTANGGRDAPTVDSPGASPNRKQAGARDGQCRLGGLTCA